MPTHKKHSLKSSTASVSKPQEDSPITVQNINVPGYTTRVDATHYNVMRQALLKALPAKEPSLTQTEMRQAVLPFLLKDLFPAGGNVSWWAKCVQLDLDVKGLLVREASKPLRWHRKPSG